MTTASTAFSVVLALPVIPVGSLPPVIAAINQTDRDSVGWPAYVSEVAQVYRSLPSGDRSHAILLAANYGEAGALERYGRAQGLPMVYSGHNGLFQNGPPPQWASVAVVVGSDDPGQQFRSCVVAAHLDDKVGLTTEEQGRAVDVCRGPLAGWAQIWPDFRHFG